MKKELKTKLLDAAQAARDAQATMQDTVSQARVIFDAARDDAIAANNAVVSAFHVVVDELLGEGVKSGAIKTTLDGGGFGGAWQTVKNWVTEWNAKNGKTGASGGGGPAPSETKAGADAGADEAKADTEPEPTPKSGQTLRAKTINKISYVFAKALTARIGQLEKGKEIEFTKGELILTPEQQTVLATAGQGVASTLSRKTSIATFAKALEGLCETEPETETEPTPEPTPEIEPEPETVDQRVNGELEKIQAKQDKESLEPKSTRRATKPRKKAGAK